MSTIFSITESFASIIAHIARSLLDSPIARTDQHGKSHPLTANDILVVAPYNAQVGALKRALPDPDQVGTGLAFDGGSIQVEAITTDADYEGHRVILDGNLGNAIRATCEKRRTTVDPTPAVFANASLLDRSSETQWSAFRRRLRATPAPPTLRRSPAQAR